MIGWLQKFTKTSWAGLAGRWPFSEGRAATICAALLLLVATACAVGLLLSGESWRDALALREAEGKGPRVDHFVRWGVWRAALINLGLSLALLLSSKLWWGNPKKATVNPAELAGELPVAADAASATAAHRRWWLAVGLLVLLAAGIRWPRMDLSLYNDEVAGYSRYIAGIFKGGFHTLEDETPVPFVAVTWLDTLWGNRMANNHVLHSVLARVAFDSWQSVSGGVAGQVQEIPLRLPALLGGLLSVFAVARLGRAIGFTAGGLLAALLLAVQPWHLRYSTEARGYGLVLGLGVLAAWCLIEALRESDRGGSQSRLRWWLGYALCQSGFLLANVGSVYLALGINAVTLLGLAVQALRRGGVSGLFGDWSIRRLLAANALSAMLLTPFLLPALPQIQLAIDKIPVFTAGIPFGFWPDVLSNLAIGMPYFDGDPENAWNPAVLKVASHPITWIGMGVSAAGFAIGLVSVVCRDRGAMLVVPGALSGLLIAWLSSSVSGATLLPWYVVFVLPFVVFCIGIGIAFVAAWLGSLLRLEATSPLTRWLGYGLVALILWAAYPALSSYQVIGKQALRDVVVQVRGGVYPFEEPEQEHPIALGWWTESAVYDPRMRSAWKVDQVEWFREKALREKRPLYFILGQREAAVAENAAVVAILEESGWFELLKVYPGLEQRSYREHVFRLRPAPRPSDSAPEMRPSKPSEVVDARQAE